MHTAVAQRLDRQFSKHRICSACGNDESGIYLASSIKSLLLI